MRISGCRLTGRSQAPWPLYGGEFELSQASAKGLRHKHLILMS